MQSLFWYLAWLLLFVGVSTATIPAQHAEGRAEVVVLDYGESTTADGGDLNLTFTDMLDDSRCPADVTCAWAGQVIVAIEVQPAGQDVQTLELGGMTDSRGALDAPAAAAGTSDSAAAGDYTVQLLAVTPYPAAANAPAEKGEYQVSLLVRGLDAVP